MQAKEPSTTAPAEQLLISPTSVALFITRFQLASGKQHITEQGYFIKRLYTQVQNVLQFLHRTQGVR